MCGNQTKLYMRNTLFLLVLPFHFLHLNAQKSHSDISDILLKKSDAVILLDETEIEISSLKEMNVHKSKTVTVLNKGGLKAIKPYIYYDPSIKVKDVEVEIFDANGRTIREIKKRDFEDVSAVSGGTMYDDSRVMYFEHTPNQYPITVSFSYSYLSKNTAFIPRWTPVPDYKISVLESSYKLNCAPGLDLKSKKQNFDSYNIQDLSVGSTIHYKLEDIEATHWEMLSPPFYEYEPQLHVALDRFNLEGFEGKAENWDEFGKWYYENLIVGRDELPAETVKEISQMLQGIEDPIEKTKKIYHYVQENTRYISVQLGIGGWMPILASEVDKLKYGDCKGLTNYTKALLKSQGIDSKYAVVFAGENQKDIDPEMASMQGNHVILQVPFDEKKIWLECTNQNIPFGYLGSFTDNRNVLVVGPDGGKIERTYRYKTEDNLLETAGNLSIDPNGDLSGNVTIVSSGLRYEKRYQFEGFSKRDLDEMYKNYWDHINGLIIKEPKLKNDKQQARFEESIEINAPQFAQKYGEDIRFKVNPFDPNRFVPKRYKNRAQPFEIIRGYTNRSNYTFSVPDGYRLSDNIDKLEFDSEFGSYSMKIEKTENNRVKYTREFTILSGRHDKDNYAAYRDFRKKIAKADNIKLNLIKEVK